MKHKTIKIKPISLALLLAGIGLAPAAYAVDLVAIEGTWNGIPMWGFATDTEQLCDSLPTWDVGPQLTDANLDPGVVGNDLNINLRNCLTEGVSIVIPGQPATFTPQTFLDDGPDGIANTGDERERIRAFTNEAPADGVTVTPYTWNNVKDGTYLYQSGSHPAKQVQMGLYGALTIKGASYPESHDEVTLLYSEIDPALHSPPAAATPLGYHPKHYLVNGSTSDPFLDAGDTNHPTLLRFLNAGLDFHVPALNSGYMSLVAEDGNAYPFPKQQYSVNLAAGKTIDALWDPASAGEYVIYDRRGNGMVASLTLAEGVGQPIAHDDAYVVNEGTPLEVLISFDLDGITPLTGVLADDTDSSLAALTVPPSSASLVSSTSAGDLALNADGSFTYTPDDPNFNGEDTFTYRANDGALDSNLASVTITVNPMNDTPEADANGPYTATVGVPVTLDGTGSSDIDGDILTYAWDFGDLSAPGSGATPSHTYAATGSYTVSLVVNDGMEDSAASTSTVEVTLAVNSPPVAVEDSATVQRNSAATFINITDNDSDPDGNLKDGLGNVAAAQIDVTTGAKTTRGGTVSIVTNGVNYTPKRNFRGTDTFSYTVEDTDEAVSNEVTVRINVVR